MSELIRFYQGLGAEPAEDGTILRFKAGVEQEYKAVRQGMGFFDLSRMHVLAVGGEDAPAWLNTLFTGNTEFLEYNHILFTALLAPDGGLIDLVQIFRTLEGFLIFTSAEQGEAVLAVLEEHKTEGITIQDKSGTYAIIAIEGVYSWELAKEIAGMDVVGLRYLSFFTTSFNRIPELFCARCGMTGEYGFRFIFPKEHALSFLEYLAAFQTTHPRAFCGWEVLSVLTQEVRFPVFGIGIKAGDNLIEKGLNWMIDLRKDNFPGKEKILQSIDDAAEPKTVGFICTEKVTEPIDNLPVYIEDLEIGRVVMSAYSFTLEKTIGYATLARDWACIGIKDYKIKAPVREISMETMSTAFLLTGSIKVQMI